ncbi:hypothetical protein FRC17_005776 [Serendipita sp. 399]|nr:hypothetical protein FRC17_005776 [Serendipita sp. 399]
MEQHTSLVHPIRRLPEEVLVIIMKYTMEAVESERQAKLHSPPCEADRQTGVQSATSSPEVHADTPLPPHDSLIFPVRRVYAPLPTPLVLSSVCTHWRDVAYCIPSIWRSITFKLSGQPNVGMWDRVRSFVERSKGKLREDQSPVNIGISLVFTGWAEHGHPHASDSLKKVMRILASGMEGDDWSTETPSHSRRQSSADPTTNIFTDIMLVDSPTLQVPSMTPRRPFSIIRFELVFDSLGDHENALGASFNASLRWPNRCPKPKEVVLIARDSVYNTPPYSAEEHMPTNYLVPPYAKTLIPWSESATLGNLAFSWPIKSKPDAYENLRSLKLVFTTYFDGLLRKPVDEDDLEARLLRDFITYTGAPVRHVELQKFPPAAADGDLRALTERTLDALLGVISPGVLEVWGEVNASAISELFHVQKPSEVKDGEIKPTVGTSATSAEANTRCPLSKDGTNIPTDADHLASPQPDKLSSSSSSPTPSHRARTKKRTGTSIVRDVLAKILETMEPTSKRRSIALVSTPEGTPRLAVSELSRQDDHDITLSAGPLPRLSTSSAATARPSARSLDGMVDGEADTSIIPDLMWTTRVSEEVTSDSNSTKTTKLSQRVTMRPGTGAIQKLIIHDAASIHSVARQLASEHNIEVVLYG